MTKDPRSWLDSADPESDHSESLDTGGRERLMALVRERPEVLDDTRTFTAITKDLLTIDRHLADALCATAGSTTLQVLRDSPTANDPERIASWIEEFVDESAVDSSAARRALGFWGECFHAWAPALTRASTPEDAPLLVERRTSFDWADEPDVVPIDDENGGRDAATKAALEGTAANHESDPTTGPAEDQRATATARDLDVRLRPVELGTDAAVPVKGRRADVDAFTDNAGTARREPRRHALRFWWPVAVVVVAGLALAALLL